MQKKIEKITFSSFSQVKRGDRIPHPSKMHNLNHPLKLKLSEGGGVEAWPLRKKNVLFKFLKTKKIAIKCCWVIFGEETGSVSF